MAWKIKIAKVAVKELKKIDKQSAKRILKFLHERLANNGDPRSLGQALHGSKFGDFWKYRIGDYRVIADIQDKEVTIIII